MDNCRAAWDKSTFDNSANKNKFLRLMGGAKEGKSVYRFPVKVGRFEPIVTINEVKYITYPYEWLERYMTGKLGLFSSPIK